MNYKKKIAGVLVATTMLTSSLVPFNAFASNKLPSDFSKIPSDSKETIKDLYEKGLLSGYDDGKFEPDRKITRAEFAAMLIRVLDLKYANGDLKFSDSKKDKDWHHNVLNIASQNGLLTGVGEDSKGNPIMKPNDSINRLEMMIILVRAHEKFGDKVDLSNSEVDSIIKQFKDGKTVPNWAKIGVAKAIKSGITTGIGDNRLGVDEKGNRLQSALFSYRTLQKKENFKVDKPVNNPPSSNIPGDDSSMNQDEAIAMIYEKLGDVYTHLEPLQNKYTKPFFDSTDNEEVVASEIVSEEFEKLKTSNPNTILAYMNNIDKKEEEIEKELESLDPKFFDSLTEEEHNIIGFYSMVGSKIESAYRLSNDESIKPTVDKVIERLFSENPEIKANYDKYKNQAYTKGGQKAVDEYEKLIKGYLGAIVPLSAANNNLDAKDGSTFLMPQDATKHAMKKFVESTYNTMLYSAESVTTGSKISWEEEFYDETKTKTVTADNGKKFVIVTMKVKENTDEIDERMELAFDTKKTLKLVDGENRIYSVIPETEDAELPYLSHEDNWMKSGETRTGKVVFEVPSNANDFSLIVRQSYTNDDIDYIDLNL